MVAGIAADGLTLFFVRSLRKFVSVDGVGFATPFHRPHTRSPEVAVTVRGGSAITAVQGTVSATHTDRCMSGGVAENWENTVRVNGCVNKSTCVKNWLSDSALL